MPEFKINGSSDPVSGQGSAIIKVNPSTINEGDEKVTKYLKVTVGEQKFFVELSQEVGEFTYQYVFTTTQTDLNFGPSGGSRTVEITSKKVKYLSGQEVSSEEWPYSVLSKDEGLTVEGNKITMEANESSTSKVRMVVFQQQDSGKTLEIFCNQGAGEITTDYVFTSETLKWEISEYEQEIQLDIQSYKKVIVNGEETTTPLEYVGGSEQSWLFVQDGQIFVRQSMESDRRTGTVTLIQAESNKQLTLTVVQAPHTPVVTWATILVPFTGYDDGTSSFVPENTVTISGDVADKFLIGILGVLRVKCIDGVYQVGDKDWTFDQWEKYYLMMPEGAAMNPLVESEMEKGNMGPASKDDVSISADEGTGIEASMELINLSLEGIPNPSNVPSDKLVLIGSLSVQASQNNGEPRQITITLSTKDGFELKSYVTQETYRIHRLVIKEGQNTLIDTTDLGYVNLDSVDIPEGIPESNRLIYSKEAQKHTYQLEFYQRLESSEEWEKIPIAESYGNQHGGITPGWLPSFDTSKDHSEITLNLPENTTNSTQVLYRTIKWEYLHSTPMYIYFVQES